MRQREHRKFRRREAATEQRLLTRLKNLHYWKPVQKTSAYCMKVYGYVADPHISIRRNVENRLLNASAEEILHGPRNLTCHTLGNADKLVTATDKRLIGRNLNFCVCTSKRLPQDTFDLDRLTRDIRLRFNFAGQTNETDDFIRKLYIPSTWSPPITPPFIENGIRAFGAALKNLDATGQQQQQQSNGPNLRPAERQRLIEIRKDPSVLVTNTDKNLDPVIIDTATYIRRALQDHLLNSKNYTRLEQADAEKRLEDLYLEAQQLISDIVKAHGDSETLHQYFKRAYLSKDTTSSCSKNERPNNVNFSNFYILPKIHKNPWKTRPVASQCGSVLEPIARWLDYMLQQVLHLCPCYLKNGEELQNLLKQQGRVPKDTVIYSMDATSMYSNIDTDHGLDVLKRWLDLHKQEILDLPGGTWNSKSFTCVIQGMTLVMRNNLIRFGDTYWIQISGTAMGTSPAPAYATIYFSYHEETALLPDPCHAIIFYKRYIDDVIVLQHSSPHCFDMLVRTMNSFGPHGKRLEWLPSSKAPDNKVDFLDMTFTIEPDGSISTKTYQKPMNLYLYLMPESSHPPGVFKGMIFGMIRRYWHQNTHTSDFRQMVKLLYERLRARSHSTSALRQWFLAAAKQLDQPRQRQLTTEDPGKQQIFLHTKYHPSTPSRSDIRALFDKHLRRPLAHQENWTGQPIGDVRFTIAYSKRENIQNLVSRTKLPTGEDTLSVTQFIDHITKSGQSVDSNN